MYDVVMRTGERNVTKIIIHGWSWCHTRRDVIVITFTVNNDNYLKFQIADVFCVVLLYHMAKVKCENKLKNGKVHFEI